MTDMTAFCLSSTFVPRALGASSERTRCLREWRTVPTRASSPRKLGVPNTPRPRMTAAAPQTNPAHADGDDTNIRIYGNNVTITESLRNYIQAKLAKVLRKYTSICQKVDVHLTVEHNPAVATKNSAEVVIFSGKTILRAEVRSKDMYAAIDQVEEKIARTVRKFKERKEGKHQKAAAPPIPDPIAADATEDFEEEDSWADTDELKIPRVQGVVRRKVFPLPLQTVEEAIMCLEYLDHSFYMFRLVDTGRVSLVYRRNHGGYGLIEPENPDAKEESLVV